MRYMSYEEFYIESPLTAADVQERLINATQSDDDFYFKKTFFRTPGHYFRGEVKNYKFSIASIRSFRRSMPPDLKGDILSTATGCEVHVKVSLHPVSILMLPVGLIAISVFSYFIIKHALENAFYLELFIPFVLIFAIYAITMVSFKSESASARMNLVKVLEGKIVEADH